MRGLACSGKPAPLWQQKSPKSKSSNQVTKFTSPEETSTDRQILLHILLPKRTVVHHAIAVVNRTPSMLASSKTRNTISVKRRVILLKFVSTQRRGKPTFKTKHSTHHLSDPVTTTDEVENLGLFTPHIGLKVSINVNLQINNKPVLIQLDTGAALSVMMEKDLHTFFKPVTLQVSTKVLQTYTGQSLQLDPIETVDSHQHPLWAVRIPTSVLRYLSMPENLSTGNGQPLPGCSQHMCVFRQLVHDWSKRRGTSPNPDPNLDICREKGLAVKREKCAFLQNKMDFLGYRLNKRGLQPQEEKLKAIRNAPAALKTIYQLESFVRLVNYYARFINNLSQRLAPLYSLLNKNARWHWGTAQVGAFKDAKQILIYDRILIYFNPSKHLVLTCDASPDGLGAVLTHVNREKERPIVFAIRTLSAAEKNYF
ncbi:hypothetical protein RRG08_054569 [Elysia crispata]|nr:hypothetical protein RRG08_054569 [Elysia crispata]